MKTICKAAIVIAVMICAAFVLSAASDSDGAVVVDQGNVGKQNSGTWILTDDGTLTIELINSLTVDGTKIPDDHHPWDGHKADIKKVVITRYTYLGNNAFNNYGNLEEVESDSLTDIMYRAFMDCGSLKKVTLNELKNVYHEAFCNDQALESIEFTDPSKSCDMTVLPTKDNTGGDSCFKNCSNLVKIGNGNAYKISGKMGANVFYNCEKLFTGCTLDLSEITYIGNWSFWKTNLSAVSDLDYCTYIGYEAFRYCGNLESVGNMSCLTYLGAIAFMDCPKLETVGDMEDRNGGTDNTLCYKAFYDCTALKTVGKMTAFTTFGNEIFYGCTNLESVGPMTNVTTMGYNVFRDCKKLSDIEEGFENLEKMGNCVFYGCEVLSKVGDCPKLEKLGKSTFVGCNNLTTVGNFGLALKTVDDSCFSQCAALKSVGSMPGLETVGASAFYQCKNLQALDLNTGIREIGASAFRDCFGLTTISGGLSKIFNGLTTVGNYAFLQTDVLEVKIDFSNIQTIGDSAFYKAKFIQELPDMEYLTKIQANAFYQCTNLISLGRMPAVQEIGSRAFEGCTNMKGDLGNMNELKYLNGSAFKDTAITSIGDMENLETLGDDSLRCSELKSVGVMGKVETVGYRAFSGDQKLETLGGFPAAKILRNNAFYNCDHLKEIKQMGPLEVIECDCFENCSLLTIIGDVYEVVDGVNLYDFTKVSDIAYDAFRNCAVAGLEFSSFSLKTIGYSAFYGCKATVIKGLESVLDVSNNAFHSCSVKEVTITSATCVRHDAFNGSSIEKVTFGSSLQFIEYNAFINCKSLVSVKGWGNIGYDYKDGLAIGDSAFSGCSMLSDLDTINPNGLNTVNVGSQSFREMDGLQSLDFLKNISSFGSWCFYHDSGLTEVPEFPRVTWYPEYCFYWAGVIVNNTPYLDTVTIGKNVKNIDVGAFSTTQIRNLVFKSDDPDYTQKNGNVFTSWNVTQNVTMNNSVDLGLLDRMNVRPKGLIVDADDVSKMTMIKCGTLASKQLDTITFNSAYIDYPTIDRKITFNSNNSVAVNNTCKVCHNAFNGISSIKYMTIAPGVDLSNASYMIAGTSITTLTIPQSTFSTYLLAGCDKLQQVTLESCSVIPEGTFKGCMNLVTVITKQGLSKIETLAFDGCTDLKDLGTGDAGSGMNIGDVSEIGTYAFRNALSSESEREVVITYAGTITVREHAFYNCTKLTAFVAAGDLDIQESAFEGCYSLKRLGPSSTPADTLNFVKTFNIGSDAFKGCSAIVNIINLNKQIPAYCFYGCQSLRSVSASVPSTIGSSAFEGCTNLAAVLGTGSDCLDLSSCTVLGDSAFKGTKVSGEANLTALVSIGENVFESSKIRKVDMGSSGLIVMQQADFKGCSELTEFKSNAVTEIKSEVFAGCKSLRFVKIPSATRFAVDSFTGCNAIKLISTLDAGSRTEGLFISDSITQITTGALGSSNMSGVERIEGFTKLAEITVTELYKGSGLKTVSITGPVTLLPASTFESCTSLTEAVISGTVTIGAGAFSNCTSMTNVVFTGVYSIGDEAFKNCKRLSNIGSWNNLGRNNGEIGDYAFYGCAELTVLPNTDNRPVVGSHAFEGCSKLADISGLASAKSLGEGCFKQTAIQTMPEFVNVTGFPAEVFAQCTSLKTVIVPANVSSIKASSFNGCNLIQTVYFKGDNPCFKDGDYVSFGTATAVYVAGEVDFLHLFGMVPLVSALYVNSGGTVRSTTITNSGADKKTVQAGYFYNCNISSSSIDTAKVGFRSVEITGTNCSLGSYAFRGMSDLASLQMSSDIDISTATGAFSSTGLSSVELAHAALPSEMFSGCASLTTATMQNCKEIPAKLFMSCPRLESVYVNQVESIGASAFYGCTDLRGIGPSGTDFNLNYVREIGEAAFVGALQSGAKSLMIGTNVKVEVTIGNNAFKGATAITKVTFGSEIAKATLGNNAFEGCTSLKSFNDGNNIINLNGPYQLGSAVFKGCTAVTKANIGNTSLGDSTFEECTSLTSVVAHTSITKSGDLFDIGKKAFYRTLLVNFGEDGATNSINLTMVRSIGDEAFGGISATNLIIGPFTTTIGSNVFSKVSMPSADLILPNTLTSVGTHAFGDELAVRSITIPSSLRTIATGAFQLAGTSEAKLDIYLDVSRKNDLDNIKNSAFMIKNTGMNISVYYGGMDNASYVKDKFDKPAGVSFSRVKYAEITYDSNKDGVDLVFTKIVAVEGSYTILPYLSDAKSGTYSSSKFGFIDGDRLASSTKSIKAGSSGESIRIWPPTDSWSRYVCDESYVNITQLDSNSLVFKNSDGETIDVKEYSYGEQIYTPGGYSAGAYYRGTLSDAEMDAGTPVYIGYYEEEAILYELEKKLKITYYLDSSCSGEPYEVVELDRDEGGDYRVKLPKNTPIKNGYTLISWETSKGIIAELDDEGKMVIDHEFVVKNNMDAWANWEAIEYTILIYDTSTQPATVAATISAEGMYSLSLSDDGKGTLTLTDDVYINKEVFVAGDIRDGWEYYMYSVSNMFGQTETVEVGDGDAFIKAEGRYANLTMDLLMTERSYAITYSCTGLEGTDEPTKPANPETVKYEKIESIQVKAWTCHGYSLESVTVNGKSTTVQEGYVALSKEYVKGKTSIYIEFIFKKGFYNVAFDYQNGSPVTYSTSVVKVNTSMVLLSRPSSEEKSGYTFDHWYWGTDDAEHSYTPTDRDMVTFTQSMADTANDENLVTFKAKWVPNKYAIKYSMNGSPETPTTDEQYTKFYTDETKTLWTPTEGAYIGHSFKGWTLDGTNICNNPDYTMKMSPEKFIKYVQNGAITLTALWSDLQFYIAFDIDGAKGGAAPNRIGPFKLNDTFTVPSHGNLYKDYCTYGGWKIPGTQYAWNDGAVDVMKSEYARYADVNDIGEYVLTLKMIWTKSSYYVTYRENGGYFETAIPTAGPLEVDTENPKKFTPPNINNPYDPYYMAVKRDGFTWIGWNYDKNATVALVFDGTFNAQLASEADSNNIVALYAVWSGIIYSIQYDLQGGLPGEEQPPLGSYNDEVTVSNPTKVGYDFVGWKITGVSAGAQYKIGKSYFDIKDGDVIDATVFKNLSNSNIIPVKMQAQWTLVSYTLQYDLNGGTGNVTIPEGKDKIKIGDSITLAKTDATKQGYTFNGWSFDGKTKVTDGSRFTNTMAEYADALHVAVLYAVWQPLAYTISYSFDEGASSSQTITAYFDETVNLDKPSKENKVFTGWKAKSGLNVNTAYYSRDGVIWYAWSDLETLVNATYYMNLSDDGGTVELVAQWIDDKFFITFNANGGEGEVPADAGPYKIGDAITLPTPTKLSREGYQFAGWSIDMRNILTTNTFTSMMVTAADENNILTLYAMWSAGSYTVQVRDTEDSEYRSTTAYFDASVAIAAPELDGYKFLGWSSTDINEKTAQYSHDGVSWYTWNNTSTAVDGVYFINLTTKNSETVHMTATWEPVNYTVVYNANGGTGTPPEDDTVYHIGDPFTLASTDSLKGTNGSKEIIGWDFTRNPNEQYPLSGGVFDVNMIDHADKTNVVTLYAVWTDGKVKMTVNLDGGTVSNTPLGWTKNSDGTYYRLIETGTYTKEALESWDKVTITKDGYQFKEWSYESEKVTLEMTVTAVYSEVNPSYIYILIGVIAAIVVGLFIFTRIERR